MNTCIKCGRPIADGDLFCEQCSSLPLQAPQKAAKKSVGKFQKPRTAASETVKTSAPAAKKSNWLTWILAALLAVFVGISAYYFTTVTVQKRELRLREAAVHAQEQEYAEQTAKIEQYEAQILELQEALAEKTAQIETLTRDVNDAESSASQSEYDLKTQQAAYEQLQEEYDALQKEYDALQAEYTALKNDYEALRAKIRAIAD